ncbi:MAG: T9SS type A sorting domain-containing protein, partial [Bacteroidota bacterium]
ILRTTDAGATWVRQSSGTTSGLYDVSFTDADTGTAVGRNGTILRTTTGGVVTSVKGNKETSIPVQFALAQNYPNPFNPSTTIEFALPHAGFVTLSVYNVLGEEVATLIAGEHAAGTFRTSWDASGLPSGVYFYRLSAGDYVQTKKAVLMR